ncbi:hypothetical protein SMB34_07030 [Thalassospira permensis NBRC 106175]|uniref:Uncharacterized protein n=1 Tax=Thalassospira permensis NBRC 106175 TaxID=1353532 RepID=A0ABR4TKZ2_9PROT|nr:hypothetical protein SMB34_07030 [Thalassospira permensis NBRC 106175]
MIGIRVKLAGCTPPKILYGILDGASHGMITAWMHAKIHNRTSFGPDYDTRLRYPVPRDGPLPPDSLVLLFFIQ